MVIVLFSCPHHVNIHFLFFVWYFAIRSKSIIINNVLSFFLMNLASYFHFLKYCTQHYFFCRQTSGIFEYLCVWLWQSVLSFIFVWKHPTLCFALILGYIFVLTTFCATRMKSVFTSHSPINSHSSIISPLVDNFPTMSPIISHNRFTAPHQPAMFFTINYMIGY